MTVTELATLQGLGIVVGSALATLLVIWVLDRFVGWLLK